MKIAAVAAGVLLLVGCGNKADRRRNNSDDADTKNAREMAQEQVQSGSGVVGSIKDAMGLGREMKCTYKMKIGNEEMETITYVNGKKYMTESVIAGNTQKMVFDGETMYSWSEKEKKGTKVDMACMKELEKDLPDTESEKITENVPDPTGEKTFEDAMDVKCEEAGGADFSIPTDVVFADQCEMMRNLMKNIPGGANMPKGMSQGIPENMPSGVNIPNMNSPE